MLWSTLRRQIEARDAIKYKFIQQLYSALFTSGRRSRNLSLMPNIYSPMVVSHRCHVYSSALVLAQIDQEEQLYLEEKKFKIDKGMRETSSVVLTDRHGSLRDFHCLHYNFMHQLHKGRTPVSFGRGPSSPSFRTHLEAKWLFNEGAWNKSLSAGCPWCHFSH